MKKPLLLYDGVCNFCKAVVRFIRKIDPDHAIEILPLQDYLKKYSDDMLSYEVKDLNSVVFIENSQYFIKTKAIKRVLVHVNRLRFLTFLLSVIPRPVSDFFYDIIAKYRYRIFGKTEVCKC